MRRRSAFPRDSAGGFTLVELLVGMAIMTMLMVLFVQMAGSVSHLQLVGKARSEANNLGRALLDSLDTDIGHSVIRSDLRFLDETATPAERSVRFYTLRPGSFRTTEPGDKLAAARDASIVEYVLYRSGAKQGCLARRDRPLTWSSARDTIKIGNTTTIATLDPSSEETLLSQGVVGLDFAYLRTDGTVDWKIDSTTKPLAGLRVSVAVVNGESLQVLKNSGKLDSFMALFLPTGSGPNTGVKNWSTALNAQAGDFPPRVLEGVRFYERSIPLPQVFSTLPL